MLVLLQFQKSAQEAQKNKNKIEALRDQLITENLLHLSSPKSEKIRELRGYLSPIFPKNTPKIIVVFHCPICEEWYIEKTMFDIQLAEINNVPEGGC